MRLPQLLLVSALAAVTTGSGCASKAECNSLDTPGTLVIVTDLATGQAICGATVTAWRMSDDAAGGASTFGGAPADASCTGEYGGSLDNTDTWTIQVVKAGYVTQTTSVSGPASNSCDTGGNDGPQRVSVALMPAH